MKKNILFLAFFLIPLGIIGQAWTYSNKISSTEDIIAINSSVDINGNVYIFCHFYGSLTAPDGEVFDSYGGRDYFIIKFTELGKYEWLRQFGSNEDEFTFGDISTSSDGYIYAAGGFKGTLHYSPTDTIVSSGGFDMFLVKLDFDGNTIWCKDYGQGAKHQRASALTVLENPNEILISGFFADSITLNNDTTLYSQNAFPDIFFSKITSENGEVVWSKKISYLNNPLTG
ncbi:MAG: hypothetical protein V2B15_11625, partial [Bacteroidota bacterium]